MYGWRGRVGFISPPLMTEMVPYEFYQMVPEGVGLLVTCMGLEELTTEEMDRVLGAVERHIGEQTRRGVDFIVLGGTPLILSKGVGFETELLARVQALTAIPITTTTHTALEAFSALQVRRLVALTTYHPWRNDLLKNFLAQQGFEVLAVRGFASAIADIHLIAPEEVFRRAKQLYYDHPQAEAVYIPCAQLHTWPVIGLLEKECGVPVVSSTIAWVWSALRHLKISAPPRSQTLLWRWSKTGDLEEPEASQPERHSTSVVLPR
jgi:maleate isomerase